MGWYGDRTKKRFVYVIREEKGGGERRMKENRKYQDESHTVVPAHSPS